MTQNNRNGKIVTFYSFKGGVGRTMTVANLAFLAALNGKRVLVMDWDLEAPGLSFYFRGMQAASASLAFDNSPGLLDILCEWRTGLGKAESEAEIDLLQQQMESGQSFANCVRAVTQDDLAAKLFPAGACLDIIGPGAKNIAALDGLAYEAALAQFSWSEFFEQQAGGFVLEKMRQWAKNTYDYVFIDSRTGWVDIAGICTMQLPDIVALCFVLNQQNISGIARVAAAIRAKRGNEVSIRAVPMRVAQNDSALESDAQAHAQSALTRIGGFDVAALKMDMALLSIPLVDHLPFYETLAPFVAKDPAFDQLTLRYLQLGNKLVDSTFEIPAFNQAVIANIKQRLQPRNATVEYLVTLKSAPPERSYTELMQLTENAMATVANGDSLDVDYLLAMLDVGLDIVNSGNASESTFALVDSILNIFRILHKSEPDVWLNDFSSAIEHTLENLFSIFDDEIKMEERLTLELDMLLSLTPSIASQLKRIENLNKITRVLLSRRSIESLPQILKKISSIIDAIRNGNVSLSARDETDLLVNSAYHKLLSGRFQEMCHREVIAQQEFEAGLALLREFDGFDEDDGLGRLSFMLHYHIATLQNQSAAVVAAHALAAIRLEWWRANDSHYFLDLARALIRTAGTNDMVCDFCEAFLGHEKNQQAALIRLFTRGTSDAMAFVKTNVEFVRFLVVQHDERAANVIQVLVHMLELVLASMIKRFNARMPSEKLRNEFGAAIDDLIATLEDAQIQVEDFPALCKAQATIASAQAPINLPSDSQ